MSENNTMNARRFGGVSRSLGDAGVAKLAAAHVAVVGVGGVGSWAVECLARSGVGRITLIDMDVIAESNINRQIHALDTTLGRDKIAVMAQRIAQINPGCIVHCVNEWVSVENVASIMQAQNNLQHNSLHNAQNNDVRIFDVVLDCIDQVRAKAALAAWCTANAVPVVMCGAAGGKFDLAQLAQADLSQTHNDPLLAKTRSLLRRDYGAKPAHKDPKKAKMGIVAVYSTEQISRPIKANADSKNTDFERNLPAETALQGLNCAGYGSMMHMTASMGLRAGAIALNIITKK